ncbi:MAG: hypothetical protein HZB50_05980 [Chloroflexi bacterium]|nr:hypothetical protein [Chloroflexota bacterium]MBI5963931.1 hypothetical protein [Chloroflexota bacterium]
MNEKIQRASKLKDRVFPVLLTNLSIKWADMLIHLIKTFVGGLVGLTLTTLFVIVTLASIGTAMTAHQPEGIQLLSTTLTAVGSVLGTFLGYYLGRKTKTRVMQIEF